MGYGLSSVVVTFSTGLILKKFQPLENEVGLLASSDMRSTYGFVCIFFAVVEFVLKRQFIYVKYFAFFSQILLLQKYCTQIQKWTTELGRPTVQLQVARTSSKVDLWKKGQQFCIAHTPQLNIHFFVFFITLSPPRCCPKFKNTL